MIKVGKSISIIISLSLYFSLLCPRQTFAGTGQIFSPAGLPQSSTQNYTPPTPGNTPTVSFPTPPLPLGEGILQSFPGSSLPLATQKSAGASVESVGTQQPLPSTTEKNTVESFFQCNSLNIPVKTKTSIKKKTSLLGGAGKVLWHVLDNLGVPMFVGKDSDLDPSLRQAYVMPSPVVSRQTIAPVIPQKIPESELEGTDVNPKNDQTLPLH